ncbi:hypothetical protein EC844_12582 [Acinetobacter calcoaceticus]|uniref:Uncharacterized protein n=1 Tax=Acinetobacter calcoaceticus TaxID=471 RepID=A0A4R1XF22_ACICA|nr:hypothetical protein EC844_12582 [Acinetobacter calcoaceticus]
MGVHTQQDLQVEKLHYTVCVQYVRITLEDIKNEQEYEIQEARRQGAEDLYIKQYGKSPYDH